MWLERLWLQQLRWSPQMRGPCKYAACDPPRNLHTYRRRCKSWPFVLRGMSINFLSSSVVQLLSK